MVARYDLIFKDNLRKCILEECGKNKWKDDQKYPKANAVCDYFTPCNLAVWFRHCLSGLGTIELLFSL